jgi:hypothetical protein
MITYTFILTTLGFGAVISLLAVLSERILIIAGLTRGNTIVLLLVSFILTILKQLIDYDGSIYIFGLFIVIAGTIASNRYDLSKTLQKGRWWWKLENDNEDS